MAGLNLILQNCYISRSVNWSHLLNMPKNKQSKHKLPSGEPYPSSKKTCEDYGNINEAVAEDKFSLHCDKCAREAKNDLKKSLSEVLE